MIIKSKNDKNASRVNINYIMEYRKSYAINTQEHLPVYLINFTMVGNGTIQWAYDTEHERDADIKRLDDDLGVK